MDKLGVDRYGRIIWTDYKLTDDGYYDTTYKIMDDYDELISSKDFWWWYATRHMRKLKARAEQAYQINEVNKLIERDTLEYLSKESELQEAIDDYKLILEYKEKIQEIIQKWNGKFTSIFSS